jgi:hypothetical protein
MVCCKGTTKTGSPCKANAAKDSAYCYRHAPAEETPESPRTVFRPEVSTETEEPAAGSPEILVIASCAAPIVDRRPRAPKDARTSTKVQSVKDLGAKPVRFDTEKHVSGVNNSHCDRVSKGWLPAMVKVTKTIDAPLCCATGCTAHATLGAHVWIHRGTGNKADLKTAFIVPTCSKHNARSFDFGKPTNAFTVREGTWAMAMRPHVMYSDYKPL